jgi:hypothetical protein
MRDRLRSRSRSRRTCLVGGGHVCVHACMQVVSMGSALLTCT